MDILKMLTELKAERQRVEEAIMTLERLARGQGRRRGRPPKWMSAAPPTEKPHGGRRFSAETRNKMAAAQKRRWAARRANASQ